MVAVVLFSFTCLLMLVNQSRENNESFEPKNYDNWSGTGSSGNKGGKYVVRRFVFRTENRSIFGLVFLKKYVLSKTNKLND